MAYKTKGKYGDFWKCKTCQQNYKDSNGKPDLSPKKELKKSSHNCDCGNPLVEILTKKDPNKIMLCCEKCNSKYFEQEDGSRKKWVIKK